MARPRNPRRVLLETLRALKSETSGMISIWDVRSTIYVPMPDRDPGDNAMLRDRLPSEYPETNPAIWLAQANRLDTLANNLHSWASWCRDQADQL